MQKGADGEAGRAVRQQDLIAFVRLIKFCRFRPGNLLELIFRRRHDDGEILANYRRQTGSLIRSDLLCNPEKGKKLYPPLPCHRFLLRSRAQIYCAPTSNFNITKPDLTRVTKFEGILPSSCSRGHSSSPSKSLSLDLSWKIALRKKIPVK